jgi:hypothetical protein
VSVDIADIKMIKIVKKLKTGKRALYGFGIGAIVGALVGLSAKPTEKVNRFQHIRNGVVWGGGMGALVGVIVKGFLGKDKKIQIEGKSDSDIKEVLEDLRKKARVPDFQ